MEDKRGTSTQEKVRGDHAILASWSLSLMFLAGSVFITYLDFVSQLSKNSELPAFERFAAPLFLIILLPVTIVLWIFGFNYWCHHLKGISESLRYTSVLGGCSAATIAQICIYIHPTAEIGLNGYLAWTFFTAHIGLLLGALIPYPWMIRRRSPSTDGSVHVPLDQC